MGRGLNATLRAIGAAAHRTVWEYRIFAYFSEWEARASLKRKRE